MRRVIAIVKLNELHSTRVEVPPWEIPILQRIHSEQVKIEGETACTKRVPDPGEEYLRLERRYGVDRDTRVPHVTSIYPTPQQLAEAMVQALEEQAMFDEADAQRAKESDAAGAPAGSGAQTQTAQTATAGLAGGLAPPAAGEVNDAAAGQARKSGARK